MSPELSLILPVSHFGARAERTKIKVCSDEEYQKTMDAINQLPPHVEHLVLQIGTSDNSIAGGAHPVLPGIPIAYPRMVFMESALDSNLNPLTALGRSGHALTGFVNKFNSEAELLDDLVCDFRLQKLSAPLKSISTQNDHWTAKTHKVRANEYLYHW